jgi:hypothetical protein
MLKRFLFPAAALVLLLPGCEARFGNDAGEVAENATAQGRAEEGRVTIEAPGFNMSIAIPEGMRDRVGSDREGLLYPGSRFGGIHIQGGAEKGGGERDGEVELSFTTGDAVDRVAAWYRDPARGDQFRAVSVRSEGGGYAIDATGRRDSQRILIRLAPRSGGGTDGRLLLTDAR